MTTDQILLSVFAALESAHFYSAFLPSVFTIHTFVKDADGTRAIRRGEVYASLLSLLMGATVSKLTKSAFPLIFTLIVDAALIGVYESAIQQEGQHETLAESFFKS